MLKKLKKHVGVALMVALCGAYPGGQAAAEEQEASAAVYDFGRNQPRFVSEISLLNLYFSTHESWPCLEVQRREAFEGLRGSMLNVFALLEDEYASIDIGKYGARRGLVSLARRLMYHRGVAFLHYVLWQGGYDFVPPFDPDDMSEEEAQHQHFVAEDGLRLLALDGIRQLAGLGVEEAGELLFEATQHPRWSVRAMAVHGYIATSSSREFAIDRVRSSPMDPEEKEQFLSQLFASPEEISSWYGRLFHEGVENE